MNYELRKPGASIDLVERARALAPLIIREADEIERTRRLTPAVTQALIENGLYRALLPNSFGGAEVPLETFMQMQEEVAKADASTAWCLGQCSVCAMTAAYLDPDAANEIFNVAPGIPRATLDAAIDLARAKTPQALKAMRDNNAVQGVIGRTEAQLRATRAY